MSDHTHLDELGRAGWGENMRLVWVCTTCGRVEPLTPAQVAERQR